ncbi:hypothetical protein BDV93DRAFT_242244 [Ceratobasidium sp. AG-I]|nr:hypothetical protein BDV93DRAFT_242244 [Ceratobasidium sp. AG-I]
MPNRYNFHRGAHMPSAQSAWPLFVTPAPPRSASSLALRLFILGFPGWVMGLIAATDGNMGNANHLNRIERSKWVRVVQMNAVVLLSSVSQISTTQSGRLQMILQFILLGCSVVMIKQGRRACVPFNHTPRPVILANFQVYWRRTICLFALQALCLCAELLDLVSSVAYFKS